MTNVAKLITAAAIAIPMLVPARALATDERLLALVPADAISVGMVRVDDMRRSATAQTVFEKMSAGGLNAEADRLLRDAGLDPTRDVDAIMVALSPSGSPDIPRVLVAATGRFDPVRLGNAAQTRGATPKSSGGTTYFLAPEEDARPGEHPAISFYDRNLVLAGTENAVVATIQALRGSGTRFAATRLGRQLFRIDPRASGWMLFDVQRAQSLEGVKTPGASPFGDQTYAAMKNISTVAFWVAETSENFEFGSTAVATDAETRELVEDVLKGLLATLRMAAQEKQPEMVKVVRGFRIASNADGVSLSGSVPSAMISDFVARVN